MKGSIRMMTIMVVPLLVAITSPALATPVTAHMELIALKLSEVHIHVPGMTCSNHSCAAAVYMYLIRLPGVMGVGVNESNQDVAIKYIAAKTGPVAFLRAIRDAGYPGFIVAKKGG